MILLNLFPTFCEAKPVDIQEQESNVSVYKLTEFISNSGLVKNRSCSQKMFISNFNILFNTYNWSGFFLFLDLFDLT